MRYRIAIHQSEEGFSISVPGLPGCWSQGATDVEAVENIKDERKKTGTFCFLSMDGRGRAPWVHRSLLPFLLCIH